MRNLQNLSVDQKKTLLNRLKEHLEHEDHQDDLITSLILRHHALNEEHNDMMDDTDWDDHHEWETLQNWLESSNIDYSVDSINFIHFTTMFKD